MLDRNENQEKYKECLNYVFECGDNGTTDLTQIVNHMDNHSNVPLHYATNYWDQQIVRKLFEYGAISSIGIENCEGEQPISKIKPKVVYFFSTKKFRKKINLLFQ